ncbi:Hypersensitive-induced response protein 4 [Hibiscus syriacus]|uniref:Hypersensitive-induced response protein 4 n=1 Tax=Hibiscus syriacus TaxID=106335 RepID=A0A6A2WQC7_HIBSY|nr:Hypersensitive-induced response protein 4 [Hibiscus syriacus]
MLLNLNYQSLEIGLLRPPWLPASKTWTKGKTIDVTKTKVRLLILRFELEITGCILGVNLSFDFKGLWITITITINELIAEDVFVQLLCSIQYRVVKAHADDAFYELQNPEEQIRAYMFGVVRALVPRMNLDDLFEQKGKAAKAVLEDLGKVMGDYGYSIEHILMVDIIPDPAVRAAMNEI